MTHQETILLSEDRRKCAWNQGNLPMQVVRDCEEFFQVQPGEVLVCHTPTPSYGIPCIAGACEAPRVFRDSDVVLASASASNPIIDD